MNALLTDLGLSLCAALRRPRTWLLALLPALFFLIAAHALPETAQAAPVQVGVCAPDGADNPLWQLLEQRSGTVVQFQLSEPEELAAKVSTSQWDCGIFLPEDLMDRIAADDTDKLLTMQIGPGSVVYPVVQETLSACIMELAAPFLGADYLVEIGSLSPEEADASSLCTVLTPEQRVLLTIRTLDGQPMDALSLAQSQTGRILRGILALLILVCSLYLAQDLGRWLESGCGKRMLALRSRLFLLLPRTAAGLLGVFLGAVLSLAVLPRGLGDLPALAAYVLTLGAMSMALAGCRRLSRALPVLLPFLLPAAALLSPIVFDIGQVLPAAGPLSAVLPVTLFLRACSGSLSAHLGLLAEAATFLLLALPKNRKNG